ncbi:CheR family methyltransferase [Lignipirellula cremea]|uniref:protein-glutamate O-methyltransferase n=1 Tax=Lignipirellula cremea TaxID=2528010 RepID=A0A518DUB5_9BACT|nr:protein-glutamate O-methyltransferase CheR [Lignipirellula cremea]QDU95424.1 Chemotaxis protein methyltransferase [Lignipirellula cremea]
MATTLPTETVSDSQLTKFANLIYQKTGNRFSSQKKTLLTNRLRRRLKASGISGFDEYYQYLTKLSRRHEEWNEFLQEVTTHETYLFRDSMQWDWFTRRYLPARVSGARRGELPKELSIWSAACSTGDEAYTIAACIADKITSVSEWKINILGTDIGTGALQQAEQADFNERAMRLVPSRLQGRFFTKTKTGNWRPKEMLTQWTRFRQHNLLEPLPGMHFDLVFVKNVFIYFDADSKRKAFENINKTLRSGGLLLSGPAEGITDQLRDYDREEPWLHRKR